jgi:D-glycerate 3-kinase
VNLSLCIYAQGGGKTTMVKFLRKLFALDGKLCSGASIDDFYLTYDEQCQLAASNPNNGLLRYRGNPGTHDIPLLCKTLDRIRLLNQPGAPEVVEVLQYDKTRHGGRGDRAPPGASEKILNGLDVFLLEGWCLGFLPLGPDASFVDKNVEDVDHHLAEFSSIYSRLDGMLVIEVDDLRCVYEWRAQPEREAINAGKPGLSPEQIRDFVSRFMPSYAQYTPTLYSRDKEVLPGKELHIKINERRQPVP